MIPTKHGSILDAEKLFVEAVRHEEKGDLKSAFECFLAAARLGDSGCQVNLGNFYAEGKGIERDLEKAAYWYKVAVKNGERCAATNLAVEYRNAGRIRSAVIWFKKAIAMKDGEACIELAKIYLTRKDGKTTALSLLRQALLMSQDDITEYGKEEAESLLKQIAIKDVKTSLIGVGR